MVWSQDSSSWNCYFNSQTAGHQVVSAQSQLLLVMLFCLVLFVSPAPISDVRSMCTKGGRRIQFYFWLCHHGAHSSKASSPCGTRHCIIREFPPWVKLHVVVLVLFPSRINCALTRSIHLILSFHSLIHWVVPPKRGRISTTALTASHALISFPS